MKTGREKRRRNGLLVFLAIAIFISICIIVGASKDPTKNTTESSVVSSVVSSQDKSLEIASWIESKVNTGGFSGCSCRSLGNQLVQCDIRFPIGTNKYQAISETEKVADLFAQMGRLASTIYYTGYVGSQRVCEFKYNMFSGEVSKTK